MRGVSEVSADDYYRTTAAWRSTWVLRTAGGARPVCVAPPCVSVRAVRAVHSVWHVCVGGMCVQVYEDAGWLSVAGGVCVRAVRGAADTQGDSRDGGLYVLSGSAWPVFMVLSQHPQWPQTQRPVSCEALWPVARCPSKKSVLAYPVPRGPIG